MITRDEAELIADDILGPRRLGGLEGPADAEPPDSSGDSGAEGGWELREFGAGWLIVRDPELASRGAASLVVERETGRVMRFPSFIPPARIVEEYNQVAENGHPDPRYS